MRKGRQSKAPVVSRGKEKGWIVLENPYTYALYYLPGIIGKFPLLGLSVLSLKKTLLRGCRYQQPHNFGKEDCALVAK